VLGLTATPTEEAYAFFNKNIIEKYTYEDSVLDGVNVPFRVYDIDTKRSHGGELNAGEALVEITRKTGNAGKNTPNQDLIYGKEVLDKTVVDINQIKKVLSTYRDSIYTDLYPDREEKWEYIPKTLIFVKSDKHADDIVEAVKEVFKEKFTNNEVSESFVQKITYSAGDSTTLIKNLRTDKNFRIAVTVTLVATGTDVRPLEVVMFMSDVKSDILYTQMKGRGCRTISDDKLKEVTPNSNGKDCFYIVDAVGVTSGEKHITRGKPGKKKLSLEEVLERLSHGEVSDDNLVLLKDYCSRIANYYSNHPLFWKHLDEFITAFGYSPLLIAENIQTAFNSNSLSVFVSPSDDNNERNELISDLISNNQAKHKLIELKKGYFVFAPDKPDTLINKGFSIETARTFIENFEKCIEERKDSIEALKIIYNSEQKLITHSMLEELQNMLLAQDRTFMPYIIWSNYKRLDVDGKVSELDQKKNVNALTHLIQIVRYAYKKDNRLTSLYGLFNQRFSLYVGSANHQLSDIQVDIMKKIAEYIVAEGAINSTELNSFDTELWKQGVNAFGPQVFMAEMQMLSKYVIGVAA
jgi:type I restriction enzyme R subunit